MPEITPAAFYLILAVVLLGAELLILQLSVFWFLFFGIGALIVAIVGWFIPLSWLASTGLFLISSLLIAVLFFPALRKWQAKPSPIAGNDAIGQQVKVIETISHDSNGKVLWSGSDWNAQLADGEQEILAGEEAVIVKLEGIRLFVGRM
jgi:membrane protein implicated in regulation of membrane protease activity